jgi:anti-sigma factor RsiW
MNRDLLLMAYVDGQLSPASAARVERLLLVDADARRQVEMDRAMVALLRAAFDLDASTVSPVKDRIASRRDAS